MKGRWEKENINKQPPSDHGYHRSGSVVECLPRASRRHHTSRSQPEHHVPKHANTDYSMYTLSLHILYYLSLFCVFLRRHSKYYSAKLLQLFTIIIPTADKLSNIGYIICHDTDKNIWPHYTVLLLNCFFLFIFIVASAVPRRASQWG